MSMDTRIYQENRRDPLCCCRYLNYHFQITPNSPSFSNPLSLSVSLTFSP